MKKRYIIDGRFYESAPPGKRTAFNYAAAFRDWMAPVAEAEAAALEAAYNHAKALRAELLAVEQTMFDANVHNYYYMSGVLSRDSRKQEEANVR